MFELENISWIWLSVMILFIVVLFLFDYNWKSRTQKLYFSNKNLNKLSPNRSSIKPIVKFIIKIIALFFFVIAMINPKMGTKLESFKRMGVDVVFAVDVSKSMLAEDISPSRLDKSKQIVNEIIFSLNGDRIGLIAYAGKAIPQLPLTTDYSAATMFLQNLNTDMLSSQGTAIGDAIQLSISYFDDEEQTERLLFIISDGEDHNEFSSEIANIASKNNIKIHTIGVGTLKGSPIPIRKNNVISSYKKDLNGEVVITKLNRDYLKNISKASLGKYIDGSITKDVLSEVNEILSNTEKKEFDSKKFSEFEDQFQWFIMIGLIFFVLDTLMFKSKTKWLKNLNLFNEE